jgi:hypothetical protein
MTAKLKTSQEMNAGLEGMKASQEEIKTMVRARKKKMEATINSNRS